MMPYLVTWIEGEEVYYRFVDEQELTKIWETEKNYIVTKLM